MCSLHQVKLEENKQPNDLHLDIHFIEQDQSQNRNVQSSLPFVSSSTTSSEQEDHKHPDKGNVEDQNDQKTNQTSSQTGNVEQQVENANSNNIATITQNTTNVSTDISNNNNNNNTWDGISSSFEFRQEEELRKQNSDDGTLQSHEKPIVEVPETTKTNLWKIFCTQSQTFQSGMGSHWSKDIPPAFVCDSMF